MTFQRARLLSLLPLVATLGCPSDPVVTTPDGGWLADAFMSVQDDAGSDAATPTSSLGTCATPRMITPVLGELMTITGDTAGGAVGPLEMLTCGNPDASMSPPQEVLAIRVPGTGMVGVRVDLTADTDPEFDAVVQVRTTCAVEPETYVGTCFDDSDGTLLPNAGFMAMGGSTVYVVVTGYGEPEEGSVSEGPYSATIGVEENAAPTLSNASAYRLGTSEFVILGTGTDPDGDASSYSFELLNAAGEVIAPSDTGPFVVDFDVPQYVTSFSNARLTMVLADYEPEVAAGIAAAASIRISVVDSFSLESATRVVPISNATEVALGATCDAMHLCAAPNECTAGTCQVSASVAAACADARAITLTAPVGGTPSVRTEMVTLIAGGGALSSPECVGIGDEQVFSVMVPAGDSDLIVTTNVPETMSDTVLAVRDVCVDASTETTCNDDYPGAPDGDYRSEIEISAPGASTQTIIVNTYDVLDAPETFSVAFRLRPRLAPGAACDPAGVMNRCASGACPAVGAAMCPPA